MAAKKSPRKVRPKTPARVKRKKKERRARGQAHHELLGLGLFALGLFLASVLLLGWDGGVVGEKVDRGLERLVGDARLALPPVLLVVGALMIARASLVDVRPFRTGLAVLALGIAIVLGEERGGAVGGILEGVLGRLLGSTGTLILGAFALATGIVLLTGASVGAVLRRSAREGASVRDRDPSEIAYETMTINLERRTVFVGERQAYLTPTEFRLLALLAREPGRIFTREQIIDHVFGHDFDGFDRTVDTHVSNLRRKLEADPNKPQYIHTVCGTGYRFGYA